MGNFSHHTTPFNTFDNRYVPYRVSFQAVHPKNNVNANYSHGYSECLSNNKLESDFQFSKYN